VVSGWGCFLLWKFSEQKVVEQLPFFHLLLLLLVVVLERVLGGSDLLLLRVPSFLGLEMFGFGLTFFSLRALAFLKKEWEKMELVL
jgi:hypothetical protein